MSRILIIEDEREIAELERDYLVKGGYDVDIEVDGDEGLKLALERQYDFYIIDVMLPGVSGFDICRSIREQKDTPIIIVTAKKEDRDKITGLGLGADDYITKPFSPKELVARVDAHLARYQRLTSAPHGEEHRVIEVRGLKIDKDSHQVFVNGEEKSLTVKEYELLLYLVEQTGRAVSREELFRKIWDEDGYGDIATVTVHVKKLRSKIEADVNNSQYIETVWGTGYRFKM